MFSLHSLSQLRIVRSEVYSPHTDTMTPVRNALLVCVVLLCGLEDAVLSQYGRCVGNQCFALFQEPQDFPGARDSCTSPGQLFAYSKPDMESVLAALPRGPSGSFWLEQRGAGGTAEEASLQNCSFVSVTKGAIMGVLSGPCSKNLTGYLCQYPLDEPCSPFKAGGGAQVKYQSYWGFEVLDSDTFPQATVAVAGEVGGEYPDSKHLCLSGAWMPAPWACGLMNGGCEINCTAGNTNHICGCPAGASLHPNQISCSEDPRALSSQRSDTPALRCSTGTRPARDQKSCEDVDECEEEEPCTGEGEQCRNTQGSFQCVCRAGFVPEDGVCVDNSICHKCEHMDCQKISGVYQCLCREGFRVSARDPTKCERYCAQSPCPAICDKNFENLNADMRGCDCPDGYIVDEVNGTAVCHDIGLNECENEPCEHSCEKSLGGTRCLCNEGYELQDGYKCVLTEDPDPDYDGSGSTAVNPTEASTNPASVPSYIQAGSAMGIFLFGLLCGGMLILLVVNMFKRCGKFELTSLKHQNMDIFYLQQVTTDTYKRLSFDKSSKNDSQVL